MALRDKLSPYAPRVLSILRIVAGLTFMAHGILKHLSFPAPGMETEVGSPAWFAGWVELVAGGLITLGLFTRPAAFIASGTMAVAYFKAHAPNSFFPIVNQGELAIVYCFVFLYFIFAGPGPWSVDAKLGKDR